ncbi:MAG: hypothetical protein JJE27_02915 [Thermoleophilia bacterium]|nr:hypothetical protein [Thermoleophilia bacterium]
MPYSTTDAREHRYKHRSVAGNKVRLVFPAFFALVVLLSLIAGPAFAVTVQATSTGAVAFAPTPATNPSLRATIAADGRTAIAPAGAPPQVQQAIWAVNKITRKPYVYGGGHRRWSDRGYDCSATVSYALHGGGLLDSPLDSSSFMKWGEAGVGDWITVYTNRGHAYAYIAGLRLDTSGPGESGPRWRAKERSNKGFRARHPLGF